MLNERGQEVPDSRPLVHPLGMVVQETLAEKIKRMVRYELSQAASSQGHETFEDADDFDVGDDEELRSPYELYDRNFEDFNGQRQAEKPSPELRAGGKTDGNGNGNAGAGGSASAGDGKGAGGDSGAAK